MSRTINCLSICDVKNKPSLKIYESLTVLELSVCTCSHKSGLNIKPNMHIYDVKGGTLIYYPFFTLGFYVLREFRVGIYCLP